MRAKKYVVILFLILLQSVRGFAAMPLLCFSAQDLSSTAYLSNLHRHCETPGPTTTTVKQTEIQVCQKQCGQDCCQAGGVAGELSVPNPPHAFPLVYVAHYPRTYSNAPVALRLRPPIEGLLSTQGKTSLT